MTQFIAQLSVILDAVDVSEATSRLQTLASLLEDTATDVVFAHHNGDVECNEAVEAECAASLNGMPSFHRITGNRRLIRLLDDLYEELDTTDEAHFTEEHMNFLERRFFEIREAMANANSSLPPDVAKALRECARLLADYDTSDGEEGELYRQLKTLFNTYQPLNEGDLS